MLPLMPRKCHLSTGAAGRPPGLSYALRQHMTCFPQSLVLKQKRRHRIPKPLKGAGVNSAFCTWGGTKALTEEGQGPKCKQAGVDLRTMLHLQKLVVLRRRLFAEAAKGQASQANIPGWGGWGMDGGGRQPPFHGGGGRWQQDGSQSGGPGGRQPPGLRRAAGPAQRPLSHLVWRFQHLHQEGVDGGVSDQLEEEEVLQALQADRPQGGQAQQQLGKPGGRRQQEWGRSGPRQVRVPPPRMALKGPKTEWEDPPPDRNSTEGYK